jgi:hypothetical protein
MGCHPEGYFSQAMERLRTKFLNVAVEAVLQPASVASQQVAIKQKDRARAALQEAAVDDADRNTGAIDESSAAPRIEEALARVRPARSPAPGRRTTNRLSVANAAARQHSEQGRR